MHLSGASTVSCSIMPVLAECKLSNGNPSQGVSVGLRCTKAGELRHEDSAGLLEKHRDGIAFCERPKSSTVARV
jgi:hypothetical protein